MGKRAEYNTEQRRLVIACLDQNADRYQTVDELLSQLRSEGHGIGRTTIYRTVEKLSSEGLVAKVIGPRGSSSYYKRISQDTKEPQGQLLCLECGRAFPLDCSMLQAFSDHVREHHGFEVDQHRTVICGTCEDCRRAQGKIPEGTSTHEHGMHAHNTGITPDGGSAQNHNAP